MSLAWMAFVAALIALEKLAPWRVAANRAIAAMLLAIGIGLALAPQRVPALTVPAPGAGGMAPMGAGGMSKMKDAGKKPMRGGATPARTDRMQPMP
jgi:hypothetical protein